MAKTLVNIIAREHPVAAYLFVKEYFEEGDKLLFVAAREDFERITPLVKCLGIDPGVVERIILRRDADKYTYERICRIIQNALKKNEQYYVNLAGGTRYMALSVQYVFSNFHAKFYYVQTRENRRRNLPHPLQNASRRVFRRVWTDQRRGTTQPTTI